MGANTPAPGSVKALCEGQRSWGSVQFSPVISTIRTNNTLLTSKAQNSFAEAAWGRETTGEGWTSAALAKPNQTKPPIISH